MPKSDQVEKIILEMDGEELEGLINMGEYANEKGVVDIPGRNKTVPTSDGVIKIPPVECVFKISRNSTTLNKLKDFYYKNEVHDLVKIITDGAGNEIRRELLTNCECNKWAGPAYDASAPAGSTISTVFLPEDITPVVA